MKRLVLTLAILIGLAAPTATPAWAGYAEGVAAFKRGEYATALREFRPLANQGHAKAQFNLGFAYFHGRGVPKDYDEAVKWYRKAAKQGYADAQYNLGIMYSKGLGVPQDYAEVVRWYRKAANQGFGRAQYNLGIMYFNGGGVSQDYVLAYTWISIALAATNFPPGKRDMATQQRETVAQKMTTAQIAEARGLFRQWSMNRKMPRQEPKVARIPPPHQHSTPRTSKVSSTGTGFYVTRAGHLLTNEHVIDGCRKVSLQAPGKQSHDAQIIGRDKANDLALLKADAKTGHVAVIRSGRSIRPGNEIVIFGFPLSGYLSSRGNLTVGRISALAGLGDDARLLQITAPVQKGNSGGPILDLSGKLVGVVVSKLAALKFAKATGTIPQNVNFAIKRRLVEEFLDANDVSYTTGRPGRHLDPSEVGEIAKKFTVKVECWK